ncbi:sensor histidine kinase [Spirosoma arcticum]
MKTYPWLAVSIAVLFTVFCKPVLGQRGLIDSLKTTLNQKLPDTTRANTYYDVANAFFKQSQFDSSRYYLKAMPPVCLRVNYVAGLGDYNRLNGVICAHQGLFGDALKFYQTAINQYTKANELKSVGKVYHNLGLLYKMMGDSQHVLAYTRQGVIYMQQAIAINQRLKAVSLLSGNYINLGILYEDLGEFGLGRSCFLKALTVTDPVPASTEDARIIYNNLGKNYNVAGQYEQAIFYLNKSLTINRALNRVSSLVHNYRNLATSYGGLGQTDKALFYADKAVEQVKLCRDASLANSVYRVLAKIYASAGQYDKAYAAVTEHKRMDDSLMSLAKTRTIAQLQGQYAVQQANELATVRANLELAKTRAVAEVEARKVKEIAAIQAEENRRVAQIKATADIEKARAVAELQTKYETQRNVQQIATLDQRNKQRSRQIEYLVGGLGTLLILLSSLVGQYTIIRRRNGQLSAQNQIITASSQQLVGQSEQLRTLMKELHHRVKNNLAIVSSLLSLQASGLRDEKAIQAVRVGQQRVEAMSLIHQRLYQTDRVTTINIQEYLTDLANSLLHAYGYAAADFDLVIDAEEQELDVDVAIPLGLIANELITNAFKYAYTGAQHPRLRIGLHTRDGLTLEVQDNGPGIDQTNWQQRGGRPSFGKRLIASLSDQLEGQFEFIQQNGVLFRLHIPETRLRTA